MKERSAGSPLKVFLIGEGLLWRAQLLTDNLLPWGHLHVEELGQADAVFVWAWKKKPSVTVGFDLGAAVASKKPIYFAAFNDACGIDFFSEVSWVLHAEKVSYDNRNVRDAYETVMADVDVTIPNTFKLIESRYDGTCKGCGGTYKKGDKVRYFRYEGTYHADCYARLLDPNAVDAALFTSSLVDALRADNVALEKKLRELGH